MQQQCKKRHDLYMTHTILIAYPKILGERNLLDTSAVLISAF